MAHMEDLRPFCLWGSGKSCTKRSTYRVFNSSNGSVGTFCTPHARVKLAEIKRAESVPPKCPACGRTLPAHDPAGCDYQNAEEDRRFGQPHHGH